MLDAGGINGDDPELARNEETVGEDQSQDGQQADGYLYCGALRVGCGFTIAL
jgi:hypothetical protein